jgi:hypothetical protein
MMERILCVVVKVSRSMLSFVLRVSRDVGQEGYILAKRNSIFITVRSKAIKLRK